MTWQKRVAFRFACAGWSDNQIPVVREYMQKYCDYYLKTTVELEKILYKDLIKAGDALLLHLRNDSDTNFRHIIFNRFCHQIIDGICF